MEIIKGLAIAFLLVTIIKLIIYQYNKRIGKITGKFDWVYFARDNWMDYVINLGLGLIVYLYDHDAFNTINYVLETFETKWRIPHIENKGFYFVLTPIIVAAVTFFAFRKKVSIPIQMLVTPHKQQTPEQS
ncbi:hypothetical protein [Aquimarina spongiae]|uniref:Uncharacterized protein n=1 Tax=Aquimarina spongiae TaxID=570521 RepID=A0A1M6JFV2_9FLAO|nr:hypothetical protein [Aquimarina spongiae]SHJ45557.1 hypothetical protein SAMN04488508_10945 [Aquimarina spongiae]